MTTKYACECPLHHPDEPCEKTAVWVLDVEYPDAKGFQRLSCNRCVGAAAQEMVSNHNLPVVLKEL